MLMFHLEIKTHQNTVHIVNGMNFKAITGLEVICFISSLIFNVSA